MGVPINYRSRGEKTISSYSYTDIAEGTGVVNYKGANNKQDTTLTYYLSINSMASNDITTQGTTTTLTTFTKILDLDFDIVFNLPKTIKGMAYINIPVGGRTTTSAPNGWQAYAIIKLRKWDGSTETEIAQAQTETTSGGGGAVNIKESKVMNVKIDASSSKTHFKKGETLRVTVELWGTRTGSNNQNVGFGHDPKGRTDNTAANGGIIEDTDSTQFLISIPFLLDL